MSMYVFMYVFMYVCCLWQGGGESREVEMEEEDHSGVGGSTLDSYRYKKHMISLSYSIV